MEADELATFVIVGGVVQTIWYTLLIVASAWRLSSRLAIMEFKVNELWRLERRELGEE